jgi:hypothetical protein
MFAKVECKTNTDIVAGLDVAKVECKTNTDMVAQQHAA